MLRVTPLRFIRLCLKEHRESLRDRRTIVTLLLMPLLVYPLLSMLLNRAILSSGGVEPLTIEGDQVAIGISAELKDSPLVPLIALGWGLSNGDVGPVQELDPTGATRLSPGVVNGSFAKQTSAPTIVFLDDDGRKALRDGNIDVLILRRIPAEDDTHGLRSNRLLAQLVQAYIDNLPEEVKSRIDVEAILEGLGTYEVRYRIGDHRSQRALLLLERMITGVNYQAIEAVVGPRFSPPLRLVSRAVVPANRYHDLVATMVPLVLVLMTMAGAVYPAIDLTAGERERGTMESLIASPTPGAVILLAKYTAVVTVATLTALANLAAMTITLWTSGIGAMIFGDDVLSVGMIGVILALLILFTLFFSALLLAITSFAKSFKEAQAYLIPLTLLAMTPGVMSLLPGVDFTPFLATLPLVNIVLLAREVLAGDVLPDSALLAVLCTCIYAVAALALASRLFGADASLRGSHGSWSDLLVRPRATRPVPGVDQMALTMAVMFPLYFVASSLLPYVSESVEERLKWSAVVSYSILLGLPALICWWRRIDVTQTLMLKPRWGWRWGVWIVAIVLAAASMWMFAHELVLLAQAAGLAPLLPQQLESGSEFGEELARVPLAVVLFALAFTPALCEEFLFRGFVLSSLRHSASMAIVGSAIAFGLMHVLTSNVLAVERFLPSTFIGLVLGYLALRTGSIWPSLLLHALHNTFLLMLARYQDTVQEWGVLVGQQHHLPVQWLIGGGVCLAASILLIHFSTQSDRRHAEPAGVGQTQPELPAPHLDRS